MSNIAISQEVIVIADYIAFKYSRFKVKAIRANSVESLFSTY